MVYADQTHEQKADRASRAHPPRVPASFRFLPAAGNRRAQLREGRRPPWPEANCPDCTAARKRFVSEVQAADKVFDGAATAGSQDYCTLYDHCWRRVAWELQEPEPEAEPEAEKEA